MKTVYVSYGNSDDKLTQKEWSDLCIKVHMAVNSWGSEVHGVWTSHADASYQNACICFDIREGVWAQELKSRLMQLATDYRQDSIVWAEATTTFLRGAG